MEEQVLTTIKYHDGFMGQRIGPLSAVAFHPCVLDAAGTGEGGQGAKRGPSMSPRTHATAPAPTGTM